MVEVFHGEGDPETLEERLSMKPFLSIIAAGIRGTPGKSVISEKRRFFLRKINKRECITSLQKSVFLEFSLPKKQYAECPRPSQNSAARSSGGALRERTDFPFIRPNHTGSEVPRSSDIDGPGVFHLTAEIVLADRPKARIGACFP